MGHVRTHSKASSKSSRRDQTELDQEISDIRYEASMCYLRGMCYAKQNAFDRAKECYKDAVSIDVQCYEAFEQLMKNSLLSAEEEWAFLDSLDFDSITTTDPAASQEASEFTKMLYTTRLSKYKNPSTFITATESLGTHYNLSTNPDLLLSKASLLYTQCRFQEALAITSSILLTDKYNFALYPLHLSSLYALHETNALFLISHDLADTYPSEPCTWLAIGTYYLLIKRIAEARRYFSKASMMDPHFGPAWIGFAHTFAAEGEHDQAISAYSTAARLFQGTHLPQLYLGMQNLLLGQLGIAEEFLRTAYELCDRDPLLLNEMGVVAYNNEQLPKAVDMFTQALLIADEIDSDPAAWISTRCNLGHAYRRQKKWTEALEEFEEVLRLGGKDAQVFCAKGLVLMEMGEPMEAVSAFHEALGISPQDAVGTELLNKALEEAAEVGMGGDFGVQGLDNDMENWEVRLEEKKREAWQEMGKGTNGVVGMRGGRGGRGVLVREDVVDDSLMELSSDIE